MKTILNLISLAILGLSMAPGYVLGQTLGFNRGPAPYMTYSRPDGSTYISYDRGRNWHEQNPPSQKVDFLATFPGIDRRKMTAIEFTRADGIRFISYDRAETFWTDINENNLAHTIDTSPKSVSQSSPAVQLTSEPATVEIISVLPNPANGLTEIKFQVNTESHIKLSLYNASGIEVFLLIDADVIPGIHSIFFQASTLTTGVYNYVLSTTGLVLSGNVIVTH